LALINPRPNDDFFGIFSDDFSQIVTNFCGTAFLRLRKSGVLKSFVVSFRIFYTYPILRSKTRCKQNSSFNRDFFKRHVISMLLL
jgi:hypothetical protein